MTTTNPEDGLARLLDYGNDASQRLRRVHLPWMTLAAQDDVRWAQAPNAFQRDIVEWLDEDFEPGNQATKYGPNFARTRSLAIDGVVYKIN